MDSTLLQDSLQGRTDSTCARTEHGADPAATAPATRRGYSPQVNDHYRHPRNVGKFDPQGADIGTGVAGAPDQGGVVRMQIRVDQSGNIEDTRFKAYGCGSTIAAASWISEWVKGKSLDQALNLHSTELVRALELPPVKMHCAILAQDAVKTAVHDYTQKQE